MTESHCHWRRSGGGPPLGTLPKVAAEIKIVSEAQTDLIRKAETQARENVAILRARRSHPLLWGDNIMEGRMATVAGLVWR